MRRGLAGGRGCGVEDKVGGRAVEGQREMHLWVPLRPRCKMDCSFASVLETGIDRQMHVRDRF